MLDFYNRIKHYIKRPITGLIHVGAGKLQEKDFYQRIGIKDVVWFEAHTALADHAQYILPEGNILINSALSDKNSFTYLYELNEIEKSSTRQLIVTSRHIGGLKLIKTYRTPTSKMDKYYKKCVFPHHNFLVLSTNGDEIKVLKGAISITKNLDYICSKFYIDYIYNNATTLKDLDKHLEIRGFKKVSVMINNMYGMAFYIRFSYPEIESRTRQVKNRDIAEEE